MKMEPEEFEKLVAQAIDELPAPIRRQLFNVAIVVEDWPDPEVLDEEGIENPADLLGYYSGVPLSQRTSYYGLVLPDKISLYREPILLQSPDRAQLAATVTRTLRHEIAHFFGIDDDRLEELGAY